MKRIKIGFLAVIALIAMSFTIVSHEANIKNFKPKYASCTANLPTAGDYVTSATCSPTAISCGLDLSSAKYLVNGSGTSIAEDCDGGTDVICCIKTNTSSVVDCSGNKPQITEIVCRSDTK